MAFAILSLFSEEQFSIFKLDVEFLKYLLEFNKTEEEAIKAQFLINAFLSKKDFSSNSNLSDLEKFQLLQLDYSEIKKWE